MNAETLHSIALPVQNEIAENEVRERLSRLAEGLVSRVQAPAEAAPQEQISAA